MTFKTIGQAHICSEIPELHPAIVESYYRTWRVTAVFKSKVNAQQRTRVEISGIKFCPYCGIVLPQYEPEITPSTASPSQKPITGTEG